jgi:selenide,water dikinase
MVQGSGYGVRIHAGSVPFFPEAKAFAAMGLVPAGAYRNREFRSTMVRFDPEVDPFVGDIFFDPQTSGGLLIGVAQPDADSLLDALHRKGLQDAARIGHVLPVQQALIEVMP